MTGKIAHATFTITRDYKASVARVFAAHVEVAAKRRWFVDAEGWETFEYSLDARAGGRETWRGRFGDGPEVRNNCLYYEVAENDRLIFTYEMYIGEARISASLATIELAPHAGGTRLTFTEQGVYLDGPDAAKNREIGTRELLEALAKEVEG